MITVSNTERQSVSFEAPLASTANNAREHNRDISKKVYKQKIEGI